MIDIVIDEIPIPWKAPYVGTRGAFSPRYEVMKLLKRIVKDQYKGEMLDIPISCDLFFYMPIPKSTSKKKRERMLEGSIRPCGPPDRTNCAKLYEDVLQDIVIKNDARIVGGVIEKWYSDRPRIEIHIEPV